VAIVLTGLPSSQAVPGRDQLLSALRAGLFRRAGLELELAAVIDDTPSISRWQSPVASFVRVQPPSRFLSCFCPFPGGAG
jgi:hypothetical protein